MPSTISYAALSKHINLNENQRKRALTQDLLKNSIQVLTDQGTTDAEMIAQRIYDDQKYLMEKYHFDLSTFSKCLVTALQSITDTRINTTKVVEEYLNHIQDSTDPLRSFLKKGGR